MEYFEFINDEGINEKLEILAVFHMDDIQYAVLRQPDSDEGMIYRMIVSEDDDVYLEIIDDDEELEDAIAMYEGIADEII